MYYGPIVDSHMHLWDLANDYAWLSKPDPAFERMIGKYDSLRRNFLVADYIALTRGANEQTVDELLRHGWTSGPLTDEDAARRGRELEHVGIDEGVVEDDVRLFEPAHRAARQQIRVARPCAHERDASRGQFTLSWFDRFCCHY